MTRSREKYHQLYDGDWFSPPMKGFREQCCDCGLVHVVDFRRLPKGGIKFRVKADRRATAAVRRAKNSKFRR